jgi:hypothetical protein
VRFVVSLQELLIVRSTSGPNAAIPQTNPRASRLARGTSLALRLDYLNIAKKKKKKKQPPDVSAIEPDSRMTSTTDETRQRKSSAPLILLYMRADDRSKSASVRAAAIPLNM